MSVPKRIGRSVDICRCRCITLIGSEPSEFSYTAYGDYKSIAQVQRHIRRVLKDDNIVVKNVHKETVFASMPLDKFIEHADKIIEGRKVDL